MKTPTIKIVSRYKRLVPVVKNIGEEAEQRGIKINRKNYDLIVSVGGDGTMINAAVEGKPVMTVKGGSRNHLIDIPPEKIGKAFDMLLEGKFREERYSMLEAKVGKRKVVAFNDIGITTVIPLAANFKVSYLDAELDADGDGVLVSTAQGSTGWSFSSNGCMLNPRSNSFLVSLLNPVMMPLRSVVIPQVPVRITINTKGHDDRATLVADGSLVSKLDDGAEVIVRKSEKEAVLYRFFEHGLREAILGIKKGR